MDNDIIIAGCHSEEELHRVWIFLKDQLQLSSNHPRNYGFYESNFHSAPEFLVVAKQGEIILGGAFGYINNEGDLLIGEIAVDASAQHKNIGSRMLQALEASAKKREVSRIILGGLGKVAHFYQKNGFIANLYIQVEEPPSIKELLDLNPDLPFSDRSLDDGWSRLLLFTNGVDDELEKKFKKRYSHISTIYIYDKVLSLES